MFLSCKYNVMLSNVNITRLYGIADIIKKQTGGRMTLNEVTLLCAVIYYSVYHNTLLLAI